MRRVLIAIGLCGFVLMVLPLLSPTTGRARLGSMFGIAWAAPDSVDEAKAKSLEALEAITRALQDLAKKAEAEAQHAAEQAREQLRSSLEKACDASLKACQKVCGEDAKCLNACKEGRRQCQS